MGSIGDFEQLILFSILRLGGNAYGVSIRDTIEERTGRSVSAGAIYTALGRLEERGLVSSRVGEPTAGRAGRPRKYYALEPEGARALKKGYEAIRGVAAGLLPRLTDLAEG